MKKFLSLFLAGSLALGLTSCLKDDEHFVDFAGASPVIDIPTSAFYGVAPNAAFPIQSTPVSYSFNVNLSGPKTLGQDVTVNMAVDPAVLTQYNTANGTDYQALPATLYQLPTSTVIKAGQRLAPVSINFSTGSDKIADPGAFNDSDYALPVRVTGTDNNLAVSSNYGYKIILVKLKNKYDGVYRPTGTLVDVTNSAFSSLATAGRQVDYTLETVSATKCVLTYNNSPGTPFWAGTGISTYANFAPVIEFDPATDKIISVTNYYGQPASNTRSAQLDPTGVNAFNPANRSIRIKYQMRQPSVVTTPPNIRAVWDEQWTFLRER
ncbi:DUF1735 domain-containing protein [Fibrella sp. USSR17]